MDHPERSTVWTYQTEDEQSELIQLFWEIGDARGKLDELATAVRRLRSRAYMRRLNGAASFSLHYFQPTIERR